MSILISKKIYKIKINGILKLSADELTLNVFLWMHEEILVWLVINQKIKK